MLVEDLEGTCITVSAYNIMSPFSGQVEDASYAFPMDSVYLILEPAFDETYLHATETYYQKKPSHLIRVDNPTHMIRLNDLSKGKIPDLGDEDLQEKLLAWLDSTQVLEHAKRDHNITTEQAREEADKMMNKKEYVKAAGMYTLQIEMMESAQTPVQPPLKLRSAEAVAETNTPADMSVEDNTTSPSADISSTATSPKISTSTASAKSSSSSSSSSSAAVNVATKALAYANRTKSLILLEEYLIALRDARRAVALLQQVPEAAIHADAALQEIPVLLAKCLMRLQVFEEAQQVLDKYQGMLDKSDATLQQAAADIRNNVESMLSQDSNSWLQPSCIDDMVRAHVAAHEKGDIAEFWKPNYVAKGLKCQGIHLRDDVRGVVATEPLKAGSVIFATKATAFWKDRGTPYDPLFRQFKLTRWHMLQTVLAGALAYFD
jgi:hypothetical protein